MATGRGSKRSRLSISRGSSTSGRVRRRGTCAHFVLWGGTTMRRTIGPGAAAAAIVLASTTAFGVDPPDARVNPVSSLIETVDAAWVGNNYNVRYTSTTTDGQQTTSYFLTTNAANDIDPRLAIAPNGDTAVVWWRDLGTDVML